MQIKKEFKAEDGDKRTWVFDTDNNTVLYQGKAKDFQEKEYYIINQTNKSAQEIIDEINKEQM